MDKGLTIARALFALAFAALATGCAAPLKARMGVLSGPLAWSRQDWPLAATEFLGTALESAGDDRALARETAIYGLASTYIAEDEYDSAIARLSEISNSRSAAIRSGVWYQAGIVAYKRGQFGEAAGYFRKSLESDPSAIDAKVNLELSKRALKETDTRKAGAASGFNESRSDDEETETIFSIVRKKERDRWKNESEGPTVSPVADY
jgi:Ca-activated chloride channel homolog